MIHVRQDIAFDVFGDIFVWQVASISNLIVSELKSILLYSSMLDFFWIVYVMGTHYIYI